MSSFRVRGIAVAALVVVLAGCGQKGPLYLPDDGTNSAEGVLQMQDGQMLDGTQQPVTPEQSPDDEEAAPTES